MRRIIKRDDGGVSVVSPAPKSRRVLFEDETFCSIDRLPVKLDQLDPETYTLEPEAEWLERVFSKATPDGAEYADVSASEIPSDRTFRGAWIKNVATIEVDMPKARDIHMDRIRVDRDKKLAELDNEERLAVRNKHPLNKSMEDIQAEKNVLCDIPQTLNLTGAVTPNELKALWPEDLK